MGHKQIIIIILVFLLAIVVGVVFVQIKNSNKKANQTSPLTSPNGEHELGVAIISQQKNGYDRWWQLTLTDVETGQTFVDPDGFPARFNIYWLWDNQSRIWVYNSDDGAVYFWEQKNDTWAKQKYDKQLHSFSPPPGLIPATN